MIKLIVFVIAASSLLAVLAVVLRNRLGGIVEEIIKKDGIINRIYFRRHWDVLIACLILAVIVCVEANERIQNDLYQLGIYVVVAIAMTCLLATSLHIVAYREEGELSSLLKQKAPIEGL